MVVWMKEQTQGCWWTTYVGQKSNNLSGSEYQVRPTQRAGHWSYQVTTKAFVFGWQLDWARMIFLFMKHRLWSTVSPISTLLLFLCNRILNFFSWIHFANSSAAQCSYWINLKPVIWMTHLKRPWCWEGLKAGGEGDDRGWDGWIASPTQWTWIWVNSGSWWWTGRPGMLQSMGSQRVRYNWIWKNCKIQFPGSDLY